MLSHHFEYLISTNILWCILSPFILMYDTIIEKYWIRKIQYCLISVSAKLFYFIPTQKNFFLIIKQIFLVPPSIFGHTVYHSHPNNFSCSTNNYKCK
uniref:Uncharacterized protein n=1 Tax=Lepeophtheirus salmonis TaxID=72036 RepID=A0A0K2V1K9_LEPSM